MTFDAKTFERLTGFELANYVLEIMKQDVPDDFLQYFTEKQVTMDVSHLELALGILGKIKSEKAIRKISDFLEHHDFNVRFVATKLIGRSKLIDDYVMKRIVKSLSIHEGDKTSLANELIGLLDRASNSKALEISQKYRFKHTG